MVSVVPSLLPHTLAVCLSILAILTLANLRGVRSAGFIFIGPTYIFIACMGITIVWGLLVAHQSHPVAQATGAAQSECGCGCAHHEWCRDAASLEEEPACLHVSRFLLPADNGVDFRQHVGGFTQIGAVPDRLGQSCLDILKLSQRV
jgi:hypothetical protein